MEATRILDVLHRAADAVTNALLTVDDWGASGIRETQYAADLIVDQAALPLLRNAGFGVLSEESGGERLDAGIVVVIDPLDGSTNAAHGVPWYATSLCALDAEGPIAALVVNQAQAVRYSATRGGPALRNGQPITFRHPPAAQLSEAIVALSGLPPRHLGWRQFRAFGASALDICLVAEGVVDGFIDCSVDAHGVWDYAGALLILQQAGGAIRDAYGRQLLVRDHSARRTPVAARTAALLEQLLAARATF
jgi:myo-inositol-1(or 4)-monophosphatase